MDIRRDLIASFIAEHARQLIAILVLAALGVVLCSILIPAEIDSVRQQLIGFPDSDVVAQNARPIILGAICFIPTIGAIAYMLCGTIDRYIIRRFLLMFTICLAALFVVWALIDLSDNISEFRKSKNTALTVITYYGTLLPATLLLLLPYGLLLALLESLGKLSSSREIIAIIQSGRGVLRTTAPLIGAGLLCTIFTAGINYHWAPTADGQQDEILDVATGRKASEASTVLYLSQLTKRLWMVRSFPPEYEKGKPLVEVEVTTTDGKGNLKSRLSASRAHWDPDTGVWTFDDPVFCHYIKDRLPVFEKLDGPLVIDSWPETPWQIIKPGLRAEHLGIPDLNAWLDTYEKFPQVASPFPYLTHWHYRWALPFTCLITVLLATPLAIHFSRRGAGGGIFLAVALSASMLLINTIILAFGESGHLPPMLAAWLPNIVFASIGIYLYRRRITGRPIYQSLRKLFAPVGEA